MTRRHLLQGAAAGAGSLSLLGLLSACGGAAGGVGGDRSAVTWGLSGEISSLDTLTLSGGEALTLISLVLEGLTALSVDDGRMVVQLAERWEQPDELTNVYTLREGVRFSDGTPLTVEDVVYSFERQLDPENASANAYTLGSTKSVEATGEREVTIKLASPSVQAQYGPAVLGGYVVSRKAAEAAGSAFGSPQALPVGTGPYVFEEWVPGERVVLRRNPHYWGDAPPVERITARLFKDEQTRLVAMRTKSLDAALQFPLAQARQWEAVSQPQYVQFHRINYLSFDLTRKPWDDLAIRRAFAYAIDREGILQAAVQGHGQIASSIVPELNFLGVISQQQTDEIVSTLPSYEYDPERARAELAKSSQPRGFEATMTVDEAASIAGQAVAENLAAIGVRLKIRQLTTPDFFAKVLSHEDMGLMLIRFYTDYPDPDMMPWILLKSEFAKPNQFNSASYSNPEVDALLERQARLAGTIQRNPERVNLERARIIGQVARRQQLDLPYLPLIVEEASVATRSGVRVEDFNGWYINQPALGRVTKG
ncbi:MAG TPA: ABC transporter substrate-binding protein [Capillimicrobium sp.]|nr:ABC transporter substrate-binding protein [Capillimicrobium sp.]